MNKFYYHESDEADNLKDHSESSRKHHASSRPSRQCEHQLTVLQLHQRIKQLECTEAYLMKKNDEIIRGIQREAENVRKQEVQSEAWRKKYELLRADNDRKEAKFANRAAMGPLQQKNYNKERASSRGLKMSVEGEKTGRRKHENLQEMLTREEREYVRQLQETKRQRSASVKSLSSTGGKKYSTTLPDGLVIHIIDNRRNCTSRQ